MDSGSTNACDGSTDASRRIAMVCSHGDVRAEPGLGAADTGAQVTYVLELSRKLAQLGYEVDIWTRQSQDQLAAEWVAPRVRIVRVPCTGRDFIPREQIQRSLDDWTGDALRRMRVEGLSYAFLNSHYWDAGIAGDKLCAALDIPHIHTPHSLGVWKQRQLLRDHPGDASGLERVHDFALRNRHEQRIAAQADLVIATSPDQIDVLKQDYDVAAQKIAMIPSGYDDTRFYPVGSESRELLRRRFGFEGKVVLALGRSAGNKGLTPLLRAFAEVAAREPTARLHLALSGERQQPSEAALLNGCRALAGDLDVASRVSCSEAVADTDLADLCRAADVFVLSSRHEPFGMTAVKAMACGTPVVVTTHGGLCRVLRFGIDGLFADTFDPVDLAITILKPLQYPRLAARLSRRGAEAARRRFTWTGITQQLLEATQACVDFQEYAETKSRIRWAQSS